MIVTDQKISETSPKTFSLDTGTGCGSVGLKAVCTVYSGLVPMSPKTTPSAPSASAARAATCRFTVTILCLPAHIKHWRTTLTNGLANPVEYERLFAESELPRWRDFKARGAFLSARISRVAFGTDNRQDVVKYAIAVEVPSHAAHSEHDADPGFQEFNRRADLLQPEDPLVYGGEVLHAV